MTAFARSSIDLEARARRCRGRRSTRAAKSGDYVIEIDPLKVHVDVNGDGTVETSESLGGMLAALMTRHAAWTS